MIVPDLNVLLHAYFQTFTSHAAARRWWQDVVSREEPIGLAPPVVFGFVRLATSRRAFETPMEIDKATRIVEGWLEQPAVQFLRPGPRHVALAFDLMRAAGTTRDLSTDAQIAAYALENRGTVHTADSDFRRFPGVRTVNPVA